MQCKPFKLLAHVLAGWLLAAGIVNGQTLGLAYTSAEAQSYGNVPVPELVYARFGKSPDPLIREQVAQGMLNKADALSQSGDVAESAATYDLVHERFGQDPAPNVLVQVLKALINKGYDLGQQKQLEAERAVYALIDREYGQRQELVLKEKLADALFNTGINWQKAGNAEAAITAYCDSDVFLARTFEEHMGHVAFKGDVLHCGGEGGIGNTLADLE